MEIFILPKAKWTRKRKFNPTYAARQVIDDIPLEQAQNQRKPKRGKTRRMKGLPCSMMVAASGQAGRGLEEWMHRQSVAQINILESGRNAIPQAEAKTTHGDFGALRLDGLAGRTGIGSAISQPPKGSRRQALTHADLKRLYRAQNHVWQMIARCMRSGQELLQVVAYMLDIATHQRVQKD